ncbi:MAG: response regulator transcription factor [Atopostipes suicloacalis]|nr:response regulator transcription factor [Atopostipes suicloacalis]MDN6730903.1 response regulator transcription factor [Atopostipes suicloacalis]
MTLIGGKQLKKENILVVEDERNISDVIVAYLEKEAFNPLVAYDGEEAMDLFYNEEIHLIILDLMLPHLSGEEITRRVRSHSNVPIIMLTAKTEEEERISGLSIGADDYVSKPFSPRELMERVKALLRRSYQSRKPLAEKLYFNEDDLEIDIGKMTVKKAGERVHLTSNEFQILQAFVSNINQVLSREQLIEHAFGYQYEGFDRTIDSHIKNIRQKIEDHPKSPNYIQTVYGAGYRFNPENE